MGDLQSIINVMYLHKGGSQLILGDTAINTGFNTHFILSTKDLEKTLNTKIIIH